MAAADDPLPCNEIESYEFQAERTVISGSCPKSVNLSHRHIPGSLEFRGLTGLDALDLSGSIIDGSVTMVGVALKTLLLRGAQVGGDVYIAEQPGAYEYIDNQAQETCICQRKYGSTQFQKINADSLSAHSFEMRGVGAEEFSMVSAKITGRVRLSHAWFGQTVSFQYLQALGLSLNSAVVSGTLQAAQSTLEHNFNLECSTVGEMLSFWWAKFGGHLQLDGTRFNGTKHVWGFSSEMQQLTLGAAEGSIQLFRLERSHIGVLRLTDDKNCLRGPTINQLKTAGMTFEWMEGDLDKRYANYFFAKGQSDDSTLYRRLADTYSARGQHDEADKAFKHQNPLLGSIRQHSSSLYGLALVVALWLIPVAVWSAKRWPPGRQRGGADQSGASGHDQRTESTFYRKIYQVVERTFNRLLLALDLLLPDLVALGARERYENELNELVGWRAFLLGVYRLSGWLIITGIIYVIVERASY